MVPVNKGNRRVIQIQRRDAGPSRPAASPPVSLQSCRLQLPSSLTAITIVPSIFYLVDSSCICSRVLRLAAFTLSLTAMTIVPSIFYLVEFVHLLSPTTVLLSSTLPPDHGHHLPRFGDTGYALTVTTVILQSCERRLIPDPHNSTSSSSLERPSMALVTPKSFRQCSSGSF
jgi:hypothetical protein